MRSSSALRSQATGEISARMAVAVCPMMRPRRSSSTVRATSTTRLRSTRLVSCASRGCASSSSTEGICRNNSDCSAETARLVWGAMRTFQHRPGHAAILPDRRARAVPTQKGGSRQVTAEGLRSGPPAVKPCRIRSAFSAFSARRLTVLPGEPSMEARELSRRMGTIDEDLGQIEKDIRQLKIEYDQYFGGGRKRPPTDIEWRIDLLVKRYNERGGDLKFAQRFRFNNLAQTYAKYKDIFRKK